MIFPKNSSAREGRGTSSIETIASNPNFSKKGTVDRRVNKHGVTSGSLRVDFPSRASLASVSSVASASAAFPGATSTSSTSLRTSSVPPPRLCTPSLPRSRARKNNNDLFQSRSPRGNLCISVVFGSAASAPCGDFAGVAPRAFEARRLTTRDARTAFRTPLPSLINPARMRALRIAAALCVAFLVAGAEAGAASPRKSPSTDASLLREKLLASKATKSVKDTSHAIRATGTDGLFDGLFADARESAKPTTEHGASIDASGLEDARLSETRRKLLWGGWGNDDSTAEPAPAPEVSAMGSSTTSTTDDPGQQQAPAPAPSPETVTQDPAPRGFLANALLLNRLRAVIAGEEGAAQSLVASAALISALRNLDPATSLFGQIIADVRERREAAALIEGTTTNSSVSTNVTETPPPSSDATVPLDASFADALLAAFSDAADDRVRELLAEAFLARLGATNAVVSAADADDGTEGTLLERLNLATLEGMSLEEIETQFARALDAGFEGLRLVDAYAAANSTTSHSETTTDDTSVAQRLALEAYRALFAASLDAAGGYVKERFDADGNVADSNGTLSNLTGADLRELLAATVEAAEANAASFVDVGFNTTGGPEEGTLSPEAAADLLDRVHAVLAAARGDFTAALESARDANGDPIAWPGLEESAYSSASFPGFLSASEIVALVGGVRFAEDASLRDIGVAFTVTDDTARLQQDLDVPDEDLVNAFSGPSTPDVEEEEVAASPSETPWKDSKEPVHERVGFQVGLPVAIVALAAIAVFVKVSGKGNGASLPGGAPAAEASRGADFAVGQSTAVASGSGSVVRRTSTSTKIEM